jgi:hypothetical protein
MFMIGTIAILGICEESNRNVTDHFCAAKTISSQIDQFREWRTSTSRVPHEAQTGVKISDEI